MNLWTLSVAYVQRHKLKTMTLFLVFLTMGSCLISLMSLEHSLEKNILHKQDRSIYLTAKSGNFWPNQAYEALKQAKMIESLDASLSTELNTTLRLSKLNGLIKEQDRLILTSYQDTQSLPAFQNKELVIEKGKHLTGKSKHQVLLPHKLAGKNRLNVGQSITFGKTKATIVGLYKPTNAVNKTLKMNLTNTVLASTDLVQSLSDQKGYQLLRAQVNDKRLLDSVLQNIKQWPLDWSKLEVQTAKEFYGDAYRNVETLHRLVQRLILIFSLLSTAVLVLMLTFWINNRIQETGILLAIGKRKVEVIGHYLIEVLLVAGTAFTVAILVGFFLGQLFGDGLMSQVNGNITSTTLEDANLLTYKLDKLSVSVSLLDILRLYSQGALICLLSVIAYSYSIVRLQPKQILSRMS